MRLFLSFLLFLTLLASCSRNMENYDTDSGTGSAPTETDRPIDRGLEPK